MAKYRSFHGAAGAILVEVEPGGGGVTGNLNESLGALGNIAGALADTVGKVPEKKRPSQMRVAFGLVALEDGSFAVGRGTDKASFAVTMTWSGAGDGGSAADFAEEFS
jgi:hypothetical protein